MNPESNFIKPNPNIQFGLKLWSSNTQWFKEAAERYSRKEFDFLELYVVPGTFDKFGEEELALLKSIPIALHAPNEDMLDLCKNKEENLKIIEEVEKLSKYFQPEYVIFHLGFGEDKEILSQNLALIKSKISNVIIENVPQKPLFGEEDLYGYSFSRLKEIQDKFGFGSCLDFTHALKAAKSQNISPEQFVEQLLTLKPKAFHLCGGWKDTETDDHLNLWEGDFDWRWIKQKILESGCKKVVFEVPKRKGDNGELENDIKNMDWFRGV